MRIRVWPAALFILSVFSASAQRFLNDSLLLDYTGVFRNSGLDTGSFQVVVKNNKLFVETGHYGALELEPLAADQFRFKIVRPEAIVKFIRDSSASVTELVYYQKGKFAFLRGNDSSDSSLQAGVSPLSGSYRQDIDRYNILHITDSGNYLKLNQLVLKKEGGNSYVPLGDASHDQYLFSRFKNGKPQLLIVIQTQPKHLRRVNEQGSQKNTYYRAPVSNRQNGFNRKDSLGGLLTPLRTCYKVQFYDLDVRVFPDLRAISGTCLIRFRSVMDFTRMQIDLHANMNIRRIIYGTRELSFSREFDAVFISFPETIKNGSVTEIHIEYGGTPQFPDLSIPMEGGFIWSQNNNQKTWMETVCQGAGAGLWWPCKDHLSEKPDSMRLSVTIPNGLSDISNGRLISRQELSDHTTKWVWYISYPINSYNVAMNIGEFSHFSDTLIRNGKKLSMDYYCMPYNLDRAKLLFAESGSVVEMYEKDFGPYPFANDGLTLMESLYPMEHQSAVSVGSFNQPINSNKYDSQEIRRTMWHELAHEWWGNSISNSDYADLWIHEAFATYSEMLNWEREFGRERMMKELKKLKPENKEPLVGIYNVNHIHYDIGDMYSKGCLMLHTFRSCMDNDSLFFDLLRAIQRHFKYQTLATNQLVDFMCEYLHKDIRPFFNLYLKTTKIPVLLYRFSGQGKQLKVECKWLSDDPKFFMPVKLGSLQKGLKLTELGTDWKSISLPDIKEKQFIIDKENFYIGTRSE